MSKALTTELVLTKEQAALVDAVKAYHAGCIAGFNQQMGYAFLAGMKLNALKELCGHGPFLKLCEANFPELPERTARRYMQFTQAMAEKLPGGKSATVADLKLLPTGELSKESEKAVLQAVHQAADGKTLTELYRDLGVIREKQKPKHTPAKPPTPDELLAAEQAAADGEADDIIGPINFFVPHADQAILKFSKGKLAELRMAHRLLGTIFKKKKGKK